MGMDRLRKAARAAGFVMAGLDDAHPGDLAVQDAPVPVSPRALLLGSSSASETRLALPAPTANRTQMLAPFFAWLAQPSRGATA